MGVDVIWFHMTNSAGPQEPFHPCPCRPSRPDGAALAKATGSTPGVASDQSMDFQAGEVAIAMVSNYNQSI